LLQHARHYPTALMPLVFLTSTIHSHLWRRLGAATGLSNLHGCSFATVSSIASRAISLDGSRPTLLTILAAAYASAEDFADAVKAQCQALVSSKFPPGYREDRERQLQRYEQVYSAQKAKSPKVGLACKTFIHRFDSDRRLQPFQ